MRITLDTNQLVRALMRLPPLATFVMAWEARRFVVVCSQALLDEYERVLTYPDIAREIYPGLLRTFRYQLRDDMEIVETPDLLRICRDPDDDKVLAVALYGRVDYLVTADEDLQTPEILQLLNDAGIGVVAIDELIKMLD